MNNKKRNRILLTCIIIAYVAMIVLFVLSVFNVNTHSRAKQKAYLEDAQVSVEAAFSTAKSEADLLEKLEKVANDYPMEMIVQKNTKAIFETIGARESELRDKARNEKVILSHVQGSYKVDTFTYQVTYNLFHMQDTFYLNEVARYQIYIIFIAMFILLIFLSAVQYVLYRPLRQVKENLESLEDYELEKILKEEVSDDVNAKLQSVATNISENIEHLSSEFTDLEQALQIEKEKLENVQMVSRAFVHDLKTPLHQTLIENEMVLEYGESISEELKVILKYNITQTADILNTINEILDLMENSSEHLNEKENVDVTKLLMEARKIFAVTLRQKELYLSFDVPEILPMKSNVATLRLLIYNVISNAIQYSIEDSEIVISLSDEGDNIIFACTNEATKQNIKRMEDGAHLFKKRHEDNEFSSGKGLLLIKELAATLGGVYELEIENNEVTVKVILKK